MKTNSDELELFVAVVDAGSLRQAAENLGVDKAVLSRLKKWLEEKLATTLLNRTTRRLSLTEEGQWFYQEAVTVLNQMAQAEAALIARKAEPEGILRVDAATPFILHQLIPLIREFRHRYPRIELHLDSSDGFINLLERRVDVAIRIGELTDSGLRAMPLGSSRLRLLAAPDYLARYGIPAVITDLLHHTLLGFTGSENLNWWPLVHAQGDRLAIKPQLRASSGETLRQLAIAGEGIACLSDFMTTDDRQSGRLVEILADLNSGARRPVNAVFYSDAQRNPRLRVWLDFMKEKLAATLL